MSIFDSYTRKAELVRVIDGDTVVLKVDLGFHNTVIHSFRLKGISAPIHQVNSITVTVKGEESKQHLIELMYGHRINDQNEALPLSGIVKIWLVSYKTGKYGRWLGVLYGVDSNKDVINLNTQMITDGFAVSYESTQHKQAAPTTLTCMQTRSVFKEREV